MDLANRQFIEEGFPPNLVRLVYFDDAGKGSEPIVTAAAVIVHGDKQMPTLNAQARVIREQLPPNKRRRFEFKADNMFAHYRSFGEESIYGRMMRAFLQMMAKNEVPIVEVAIERKGYNIASGGRLDIYDYAFASCAIFVAAWLKENAGDEGALCIADQGRNENAMHLAIRDLRLGVPEVEIPAIDAFIDMILFQNSKRSLGVQMADYANFFLKMHCIGDKRAEPFFQIIEPLYTEKPIIAHFAGAPA